MKIFHDLLKLFIVCNLLFPSLLLSPLFHFEKSVDYQSGIYLGAAEEQRKTRKTPAMRERIYSQLARAQKLADEKQVDEGLAVLDRVKTRIEQLNSYEKAMLWNFYGFIYYGKDDSVAAIKAFEKVVEQKNIPESLELSTLFSLAQLNMVSENYDKTVDYLNQWSKTKAEELNDNGLVLSASAYYAKKEYQQALAPISRVVEKSFENKKIPKENWLVLKRALHYELKQTKDMVIVSEQLVRHYSKDKYWIELANMYGETEQTVKQLAVMEAAHQQGFVTKRSDIQSLAQLYFMAGAPYKAAQLLSKSIKDGVVLENIKILNYLAQAWTSAKQLEKAVPVLKRAAYMSKSGNLNARLAETYLELEKWDEAISSAIEAKKKGDLDNPGNMDIAIGIAYFNLNKFSLAIESFKFASKEKRQKKMADQWLKYTEREKHKNEQLQIQMDSVGS